MDMHTDMENTESMENQHTVLIHMDMVVMDTRHTDTASIQAAITVILMTILYVNKKIYRFDNSSRF